MKEWFRLLYLSDQVPPSQWLGITAENQRRADERIPVLLQIPAAVRWVSLEPLLGPVKVDFLYLRPESSSFYLDGKINYAHHSLYGVRSGLNWVVIGCETGPKRRPCRLEWVRDIIEQCDAAGVPVFVKQIEVNGKVSHDPKDWPEWAKRREFPHVL